MGFDELWTVVNESAEKVDWLNDRIQPFAEFKMPDGGWASFPLGIFILSTPTKQDQYGYTLREVEAYDGLVILEQDKFTARTAFAAGRTYKDVVESILRSAGITKMNLNFPDKKISTTKEYPIGETKLSVVNELLNESGMDSLWVDAYGYFNSAPYRSPAEKTAEFEYLDDELSIIVQGVEEELDLFEVYNSWVVTVSNPESTPLVARKENTNPNSVTSIPNRGRKIVDFRQVDDIADQAALNAYVERIAFEASQVYGRIKFNTPIMPFHEYYDVIKLRYRDLDIDGTFAEVNWTIPLKAGAEMTHEVRKVVTV